MCCHMLLPTHAFPSSLGNTPVTEIEGSPFHHGGVILDVGGGSCSGAINDPTACVDPSGANICSSTGTDVLASSRKNPHIGLMGGMLPSSSFSSWICWKWVLILNQKNHMGLPGQLVFICLAFAGQ